MAFHVKETYANSWICYGAGHIQGTAISLILELRA